MRKMQVRRVGADGESRRRDRVAIEEPLEIQLEDAARSQSLSITMRTPGADFELAAGFLHGEGLLRDRGELAEITYCQDVEQQEYNVVTVRYRDRIPAEVDRLERNFYTSSACGVCGRASLESVEALGCEPVALSERRHDPALLLELPGRLRAAQSVFEATGGVHAAGIFRADGTLETVREDVGRHNAVDKAVGDLLLQGRLTGDGPDSGPDRILVVSGRASFEILQKAAMAGLGTVVAVGAPSSLAVDLAQRFGITLVGFARGESMNVYADPGRLAEAGRDEGSATGTTGRAPDGAIGEAGS